MPHSAHLVPLAVLAAWEPLAVAGAICGSSSPSADLALACRQEAAWEEEALEEASALQVQARPESRPLVLLGSEGEPPAQTCEAPIPHAQARHTGECPQTQKYCACDNTTRQCDLEWGAPGSSGWTCKIDCMADRNAPWGENCWGFESYGPTAKPGAWGARQYCVTPPPGVCIIGLCSVGYCGFETCSLSRASSGEVCATPCVRTDVTSDAYEFTFQYGPCPPASTVAPTPMESTTSEPHEVVPTTSCKHLPHICQEVCSKLECGLLHPKCIHHCSSQPNSLKHLMSTYCDDFSTGGCKDRVKYCRDVCLAIEGFKWWELKKCELKCAANFGYVSGIFKESCESGICPDE